MDATTIASDEVLVRRRLFPSWSIAVPPSMAEAFVTDGGYWHAFADDRSISMTSMKLTERGRPVPARCVVGQMPPPDDGDPVDGLPPDLLGWAVTMNATRPACASRILSGLLATEGCVAIVTITSDDGEWARSVWMSIRAHDCPVAASRSAPRHRPAARRSAHRR